MEERNPLLRVILIVLAIVGGIATLFSCVIAFLALVYPGHTMSFIVQLYSLDTPTPIVVVVTAPIPTPSATSSRPTNTPTQAPTPTATYTPRPTATSVPTRTPTPTPPGVGGKIGTDEFWVELVDYLFRPPEHPENAAVEYTLRFVNNTSIPIEVEFTLEDLTAYDNKAVPYGDYFAISKRAYDRGEVIILGSVDWPKYLERRFTLQPGEDFVETYYLNKESAGWEGRSRVDIDTDWIEIRLPINYRSDQFHRLNAVWRLVR